MMNKNNRRFRSHGPRNLLIGLLLVIVIAGGIFMFSDVGGRTILSFVKKILRDNANIELTAEEITGNPVRGYTVSNFSLSNITGDGASEKLFSAQYLSACLSFRALLHGALRLSELSVGGVEMDLDKFLTEIEKIKLPVDKKESDRDEPEQFNVPIDRVSLKDSKFITASGQAGVLEVEISEINADITDGRSLAINLDGRVNKMPLTGRVAMDVLSGTTASIKNSEVHLGSAKIFVTGGIAPAHGQNAPSILNLQGAIQSLNLKELAAIFNLGAQDYDGTANVNAEVQGTVESLKVSGTIDYNGKKVASCPFERLGANIDYSDGRVSITNISALAMNVPISGEAEVTLAGDKNKPVILLNLEGLDASLENLFAAQSVGGRVSSFGMKVQGPIDNLTGAINLSAPRITYRGESVTNLSARLDLTGNNSAKISGKFRFRNAQGSVQGDVRSFMDNPRLNLTGRLLGLDLHTLSYLALAQNLNAGYDYNINGKLDASLTLVGTMSKLNITGAFSSAAVGAQVQDQDIALTNAAVSFTIDPVDIMANIKKQALEKISGTAEIASAKVKAAGLNISDVRLPVAFEYVLSNNKANLVSKGGVMNLYGGKLANTFELDYVPISSGKDSASIKFANDLRVENINVNAFVQDVTRDKATGRSALEGQITGRGNFALKLKGELSGAEPSYSGSGQLDINSGAITGFKILDIIARVHGTQGLRYASVTAPFVIQNGKLILKSGAVINAIANDPMYKYAKLSGDGVIGFDQSLNIPVESVINYQLINALVGGGKGTLKGVLDVVKDSKNLTESLNAILGGGLSGAQREGGQGDYRTVTLSLLGNFSSPTVKDLRIGESTLPKKSGSNQKQASEQNRKSVTDAAKDLLLKGVTGQLDQDLDLSKKPTELLNDILKTDQDKNSLSEGLEDRAKQELGRQLQKGLGSLFKR